MITGGRTLRRVLRGAAVALLAASLAPAASTARTPGPDPTFGRQGVVVDRHAARDATVNAVAVQPDGRVVVAGSDFRRNAGERFLLVRYRRDGRRDPTFGTRGVVRLSFGARHFSSVSAMELQRDGRIVVAGHDVDPDTGDEAIVVARFRRDGTLDPGFGDGGTTRLSAGPGVGDPRDLTLTDDGRILVAGSVTTRPLGRGLQLFVLRVRADGVLDESFGNRGVVRRAAGPAGASADAVAVQPNGRVVVAADTYTADRQLVVVLARFTRRGVVDRDFGRDGLARTRAPGGLAGYVSDLAVQAGGRIVVVGEAHGRADGDRGRLLLTRFTYRGALDRSFGDRGTRLTAFGGNPTPAGILVRPHGRIVVGATSDRRFGLVRYHAGGALDTAFGDRGRVTVRLGDAAFVGDLAAGRGGQLVLGGSSTDTSGGAPDPASAVGVLAYQP